MKARFLSSFVILFTILVFSSIIAMLLYDSQLHAIAQTTTMEKSTPTTIEGKLKGALDPSNTSEKTYKISNIALNFSGDGNFCSSNECIQNFTGEFRFSNVDTIVLDGVLKIENKTANSMKSNTQNWSLFKIYQQFTITNIQEDKTNNKISQFFEGSLDIGNTKYNIINGKLELPSGLLTFKGQESV